MAVSGDDLEHLRRCADLARIALQGGDEPFGSLIVDGAGTVRFEDDMCAAAHAWVGLGRIVYAASAAQLTEWLRGWGAPLPPVAGLAITAIAPGVTVDGPAPELEETMKTMYAKAFGG